MEDWEDTIRGIIRNIHIPLGPQYRTLSWARTSFMPCRTELQKWNDFCLLIFPVWELCIGLKPCTCDLRKPSSICIYVLTLYKKCLLAMIRLIIPRTPYECNECIRPYTAKIKYSFGKHLMNFKPYFISLHMTDRHRQAMSWFTLGFSYLL